MPLVAALAVVVLAAVGYLAGGEQIRRLLRSPTPAPESAIEPAEAVAPTEVVPPPAETPATGVVARPTPARREAPVAAVPTPAPAAAPTAEPTVEPTALPPTAPPLDEPVPTEPPPVAPVAAAPAETPRPRTRAGDLVDIALVDTRPVVVTQAPPEYPRIARAQRATGLVTLRALINERGTIDNVQVISSPRRDFSDAAVAAVRQYRYTPAMKDGVPVRVWHQIVLNFTLAP
jgi:protein TonB